MAIDQMVESMRLATEHKLPIFVRCVVITIVVTITHLLIVLTLLGALCPFTIHIDTVAILNHLIQCHHDLIMHRISFSLSSL